MPATTMPAELAAIIALHRDMFGGWTMQADADTADDTSPPDNSADAEAPTDGTDWKAEARKWEARAKSNSAAAAKLAKLEDAQKTETQRLTDNLSAVTGERDKTAAELAAARLELAIVRHAGAADPAKLLDSRSFLASVQGIDPNNTKALTAAITEHLKSNPHLARQARSSGDTTTGHNPAPASHGLNALLRAAAGH